MSAPGRVVVAVAAGLVTTGLAFAVAAISAASLPRAWGLFAVTPLVAAICAAPLLAGRLRRRSEQRRAEEHVRRVSAHLPRGDWHSSDEGDSWRPGRWPR